jgi:hypothetical protein
LRVIGKVVGEGDGKTIESHGKTYSLENAGALESGLVYRIIGTLSGSELRVEMARKLEAFDLPLYERALGAALKKSG